MSVLPHGRRTPGNRQPDRRQAGVTLIELMVAMIVLSIAIAAVFQLGLVMLRSASEHRKNVQVEQSTRASLAILTHAIRNSSPGVPRGNLEDLVGCTPNGGLRITNSSVGPDALEVIHSTGGVVTSLREPFGPASPSVQVMNASQLRPGDYVVVTNLDMGHILRVKDIQPAGPEFRVFFDAAPSALCGGATFPSTNYRPGDLMVRAQASYFYIDSSAAVGGIPTLMMDPDNAGPLPPEPLAAGIEDMQIAIGVDANDDKAVAEDGTAADEWHYNAVGDLPPPLSTTTPWRALRITLVGRSLVEQEISAIFARPAVEDRAGSATPDVYRRRVLATTVEIRNMEGSP